MSCRYCDICGVIHYRPDRYCGKCSSEMDERISNSKHQAEEHNILTKILEALERIEKKLK